MQVRVMTLAAVAGPEGEATPAPTQGTFGTRPSIARAAQHVLARGFGGKGVSEAMCWRFQARTVCWRGAEKSSPPRETTTQAANTPCVASAGELGYVARCAKLNLLLELLFFLPPCLDVRCSRALSSTRGWPGALGLLPSRLKTCLPARGGM